VAVGLCGSALSQHQLFSYSYSLLYMCMEFSAACSMQQAGAASSSQSSHSLAAGRPRQASHTQEGTAAMVGWQVPRCSAMLRHFQGDGSGEIDHDEVTVTRQLQLRERLQARQCKQQSRGDERWLALFGGLERGGGGSTGGRGGGTGGTGRVHEMRPKYGRFMRLVSDLAAEGSRVEEQHAVALFLYEQLTSRVVHAEHLRRQAIEGMVGPIAKGVFREMKILVDDLSTDWVGKNKPASSQVKSSRSQAATPEFGEALPFVLPSVYHEPLSPQAPKSTADNGSSFDHTETLTVDSVAQDAMPCTAIDCDWLLGRCLGVLGSYTDGATGIGDATHLAQDLQRTLASRQTDTELQNQLFDLLGDFDFVGALLSHRQQILCLDLSAYTAPTVAAPEIANVESKQETIRVGVTLTTEQEKKLQRQQRKQMRKLQKASDKDPIVLDALASHASVIKARREAWQTQVDQDRDSLIDAVAALPGDSGFQGGGWAKSIALPKGTTRTNGDGYEEVFVPMARRDSSNSGNGADALIAITDLPDYARLVFRGIKRLNRLQSRVFETAFYSNENMLVCAPTGAGKTNVAMLCILREIGDHFTGGILHREDFKIVYVAPMKALAREISHKFNQALMALGVVVKELTGDVQLTKKEIQDTQVIVTTPEKWDVITRKSGDAALTEQVRVLIIDEVHLLNEDRGAVIETLVARTLRQVEASQSMIRIVGLSATLPNYADVAEFLRVNHQTGLFFFDDSFRPVPLSQYFIGVKQTNHVMRIQKMNDICWQKARNSVDAGKQALVFVHARNDTVRTAQTLVRKAQEQGRDYSAREHDQWALATRDVARSQNQEMKELFKHGFGIHHAGMLRQDRLLMERMYEKGLIKVLVCTATLAWGVNLPAYTVIIKGTQIYNPEQGGFVQISMLDVMQCFGRAGRPQYDTHGEGIIITSHDKLNHYLAMLNHGLPIESTYIKAIANHLNAEVVLGTVTNVDEAVTWLGYTYLSIRMKRNPLAYGISWEEKHADPMLVQWRRDLIQRAADRLRQSRMIRYDRNTGHLNATNLGRIASHFYVNVETVETFTDSCTGIHSNMSEAALLALISEAKEFENVKVRPEEMTEVDRLHRDYCQVTPVKGGADNPVGKINILLQAYLSRARLQGFALVSDQAYVINSAARLVRALFEIVFRDKGWVTLAMQLLDLAKAIDKRIWYCPHAHPLAQFDGNRGMTPDIIAKLEARGPAATIERLRDMTDDDIGALVFNKRLGGEVGRCVRMFPMLEMDVSVQPITRTVLRVELTVRADFQWNDRLHGINLPWWIWVQDAEIEKIYYTEYFLLNKMQKDVEHKIFFTIPIADPPPPQYFVYAESDRWLGAGAVCEMNFRDLLLPQRHASHTDLLDLTPLPKEVLRCPEFEALYPRFSHFNAIQTQIFHCMYHTDNNALIGAPTGSGKTNCGELAMLRVFKVYPNTKIVYIAPLKALVRERMIDWKERLVNQLGKSCVELTGDSQSDARQLARADVICTTPEKWDGVSRTWAQRDYVKQVSCVIMDEIHLLGGDRGPILEVIVSRMRYIASQRKAHVRFVGLSTALANARDLADWLGIDEVGLFVRTF
jgi:activating signal cointegrator complex subunit 3